MDTFNRDDLVVLAANTYIVGGDHLTIGPDSVSPPYDQFYTGMVGTVTDGDPDSDGDIKVEWPIALEYTRKGEEPVDYGWMYVHTSILEPAPVPDINDPTAIEAFLNPTGRT